MKTGDERGLEVRALFPYLYSSFTLISLIIVYINWAGKGVSLPALNLAACALSLLHRFIFDSWASLLAPRSVLLNFLVRFFISSLISTESLHTVRPCLGQTGYDHGVFEIFKSLLLVLLEALKPTDKTFFILFELLSLTLILIDQLLFIVDLIATFGTGIS